MTKSNFKCILFLLVAIAIIVKLATTITASKYTTNVSGSGTINVATCEADIAPINFNPANLKKPGDVDRLTFNVTNYTNEKTSEVNQNYSIEITTSNNLPFTYQLQCTSTESNGTGINLSNQSITPNVELSGGMLPFSEETTHQYTLTVTWPSNETDISLINEIELISINVKVEQIV